jgi:adenylosuccinate synthase
VLLDQLRGFHPYTTWSTVTSANAHALLDEAEFDGERRTIGVTRAFSTRHGPGPFPSNAPELREYLLKADQEEHNVHNEWQGMFRVGWFDFLATNYAIAADGRIDALAITCLDRLRDLPRNMWNFVTEYETERSRVLDLQQRAKGPPSIESSERLCQIMSESVGIPRTIGVEHLFTFAQAAMAYAENISLKCQKPIDILSFGPKYTHKDWSDWNWP